MCRGWEKLEKGVWSVEEIDRGWEWVGEGGGRKWDRMGEGGGRGWWEGGRGYVGGGIGC